MVITMIGFLLHGIVKYINGNLEKLDEHFNLFIFCWGVLVPFVTFQILMCVRDEGANIKALHVCSPLLALFLGLFFLALDYAYKFKSAFQINRETNQLEEIGSRLLFSF